MTLLVPAVFSALFWVLFWEFFIRRDNAGDTRWDRLDR